MIQFRTHSLTLSAVFTVAALLASPAYADSQTDTVVVNYSDLNLNAKAGVDTLRRRLIVASRSVCGDSARELSETADEVACRDEALKNALRDLRLAVASAETSHSVAVAAK